MKLALFTAQIGHYHNARYLAAERLLPGLTVLASQNEAQFAEFMAPELGAYRIRQLCGGRDAYLRAVRDGSLVATTEQVLAETDPDIIAVAGWATPESFVAIRWARRNGRRLVMLSASTAHDAVRHAAREAVKSRIVRACDAALVGGRHQLAYVVELGLPGDCVFQGYDAVDNNHFERGAAAARRDAAALRARFGLPDRYVLASARFIPKKNLPRLVAAFAQARASVQNGPDLVLLGDGEERPTVEAAIAAADASAFVRLPGFRSYDVLPAYYGLAEAFVHVSTSEQWGLVINEAAAAGLPLVVSRPCGAADELVVHGENGYLVDPLNVADMATALHAVMTLSADEHRRMGAASKRIVSDWGPERFAAGLAEACNAALRKPPRRLAPWDDMLLRTMATRTLRGVD